MTGGTDCILKAFSLMSAKLEEDMPPSQLSPPLTVVAMTQPVPATGHLVGRPQVTLRLIVPASQCGSLIGKGGAKIKEIREMTGATIQVASEMLVRMMIPP